MANDGSVLERTKYTNKRAAAAAFAKYAAAKYNCAAVFESTGNYGFKTQLALEGNHIPFKIANPLRLKMSQSGLKTDKLDAERLANRLRMDDIPESYAYPPEDRRVLDILHDRINQVKARVTVLNRQHSILAKYDYEISASGSTDSASDKCQEFLDNLKLDEGDMRRMAMHVQDIRHINGQIRTLEGMVSKEALQNEDAKLIMSLMGFDAFSALLVAVSISRIERFPHYKQLVSFLGLCPRIYQSGDRKKHGRMKKAADRNLTWIMMHAAMVAVRHDPRMKARYETLRKQRPPVVAYSHVANYMAYCIYYMLKRREPYRYHNKSAYETKLKRLDARCR